MGEDHGRIIGPPTGPDHGCGQLGRVAGALLAALNREEAQPEIAMVYNILADPPGPASYAVMELEEEMWSLAPSLADTFALLIDLASHARRWNPTEACRSRRHRPDGIVMIYCGVTADTSTEAGNAIVANLAEGYYRHGDVRASPAARIGCFATALDRADTAVRLVKLGVNAPVADIGTAFGVPDGAGIMSKGGVDTGLAELLAAMHTRWQRLPLARG